MDNLASLKIAIESSDIEKAKEELEKLSRTSTKTEQTTNNLTNSFKSLSEVLRLLAVVAVAKNFIEISDEMTQTNDRLRLVTKSTTEYESQQKALFDISLKTHSMQTDTITLYTKLDPALKQVGASTEGVNRTIESFQKGLKLGGASVSEASSATLQFAQAMGSGVLRGEEFNAILEASPKLMQYMAKGMGVPVSALRKIAEEGKLTADKVSIALLKTSKDIDKDFGTLRDTVGNATVDLKNQIYKMVDEIDKSVGITQGLSNMMTSLSRTTDGSSDSMNQLGYALSQTTKDVFKIVMELSEMLEALNSISSDGGGLSLFQTALLGVRVTLDTIYVGLHNSILMVKEFANATSDFFNGKETNFLANTNKQLLTFDDLTNRYITSYKQTTEVKKKDNKVTKQNNLDLQKEIANITKKSKLLNKPKKDNGDAKRARQKAENEAKRAEQERLAEQKKFNDEGISLSNYIAIAKAETDKKPYLALAHQYQKDLKEFAKSTKIKTLTNEKYALDKKKLDEELFEKQQRDKLVVIDKKRIQADLADMRKIANFQADLINTNIAHGLAEYEITKDTTEKTRIQIGILESKKEMLLDILKAKQSYADTTGDVEESRKLSVQIAKIEEFNDGLGTVQSTIVEINNELDRLEDLKINVSINGFDDISNGIADVLNKFSEVHNAQVDYSKEVVKSGENSVKSKEAELKIFDAQIGVYSSMSEAMGNFYDEDDDRKKKQAEVTKVLNAIQMASQIAQMAQSTAFTSMFIAQETAKATSAGVTAVAISAQSSPWTGIATAGAMLAMLASLGIMLGGKGSTSTTSDSFSAQKANEGKGSSLGDSEKASESILKALDILGDLAKPELSLISNMNKSLISIDEKMGGVSSLISQRGGFALGENYQSFDSGSKNNVSLGSLGVAGLIGSNIILDKLTGGAVNGLLNSVLGGIFGSKKVTKDLQDSGISFADVLLTSAKERLDGDTYQTVATTTTKKSWFSKSTSTSVNSYFEGLDDTVERQFASIFDNLYNATLLAGEGLDTASSSIENELSDFVISIGKVSLKDKTGEEIQETLSNIFGKIGDDIAKDAFPLLTSFQKVGEGLFETMTRVSSGMEESEYYISKLGVAFEDINYKDLNNKLGDVATEAVRQSILKFEGAFNGVVDVIDSLSGSAEDIYDTYTSLNGLRIALESIGTVSGALGANMLTGAGGINALEDATSNYIENYLNESEQIAYKTNMISDAFKRVGVTAPKTKEEFTKMLKSIDVSTASGQELYGRVILLSESFDELTDSIDDAKEAERERLEAERERLEAERENSNANIKTYLDSFKTQQQLAEDMAKSFGLPLSSTFKDLDILAEKLILTNGVLTDSELELLSANKQLIETDVSEYINKITDSVNGLRDTSNALEDTIDGLRNKSKTSDESLKSFYQLVANSREALKNKEYGKYSELVSKVSGMTDILQDNKNFTSAKNMQFAQFSTANSLEEMNINTLKEIDYLEIIAKNTEQTKIIQSSSITGLTGFATGGYTGNGGRYDVAGIVHSGEYVINAPTTKALGLNNGDGGVFKEMISELSSLRAEISMMKQLSIRQTATQEKQLTTQRQLLGIQGA